MAIAYTAAGYNNSGGANSSSVNVAASGSDRIAILFAWGDFATAPAVTVGGSSTGVELIGSITLTGNQKIYCYYYLAPSTSSTAYAVTLTNSYPEIHVLMYSGASQTGVPDSFASKTGDTVLDLTTTVVASDCWLVSAGRDYTDGDIVASTGTTSRNAGAGIESGDSNGVVGTGAQTMEWSNNGSGSTGGFIISIKPVASASLVPSLASLGVGA